MRGTQRCGWIGELHPQLVQTLDLPEAALLFELDWEAIRAVGVPKAAPLSEFPSSRRDLAIVVAERSEEHTSELQSLMRLSYAVFCLKNKNKQTIVNKPKIP